MKKLFSFLGIVFVSTSALILTLTFLTYDPNAGSDYIPEPWTPITPIPPNPNVPDNQIDSQELETAIYNNGVVFIRVGYHDKPNAAGDAYEEYNHDEIKSAFTNWFNLTADKFLNNDQTVEEGEDYEIIFPDSYGAGYDGFAQHTVQDEYGDGYDFHTKRKDFADLEDLDDGNGDTEDNPKNEDWMEVRNLIIHPTSNKFTGGDINIYYTISNRLALSLTPSEKMVIDEESEEQPPESIFLETRWDMIGIENSNEFNSFILDEFTKNFINCDDFYSLADIEKMSFASRTPYDFLNSGVGTTTDWTVKMEYIQRNSMKPNTTSDNSPEITKGPAYFWWGYCADYYGMDTEDEPTKVEDAQQDDIDSNNTYWLPSYLGIDCNQISVSLYHIFVPST